MEKKELWLWLANGLGPCAHWLPLLENFGSLSGIYENRLYLLHEKLITARQSDRLLAASPADMAERLRRHEEKGIRVLCFDEEDYPAQLRPLPAPPVVLYARGDVRCLQNRLLIGMVGARHPSAYGVEAARTLSEGLAAAGAVLVSGLAEGLDAEAHKAALRAGVPTVGVLGTDLDTVFPARHKTLQEMVGRTGVLLSEYPCDVADARYKETFVQRNRIIAGLSRGVCVAEARLRSGTMSTVRFAMEFGRDVFAVPGSIFSELSEGTNAMLKEGAAPVTRAADLLGRYGVDEAVRAPEMRAAPSAESLSGELAAVYGALGRGVTAAEVCQSTGLPSAAVLSALTRLEMRGLVRQTPGRRFEKSI